MDQKDHRDHGVKPGKTRRRAGSGPDPVKEAVEKGLIEKARQIVEQTPEIRPERVAALKAALEQGNYEIDSRKLANLLITEFILLR